MNEKTECVFDLHFFCDECGETHGASLRMGMQVDEPPEIGNPYAGIALPPEAVMFTNNRVTCPNTGRLALVKNNHQTFLVRVS